MVFCAQASLAFSSAARRDAVLADLETQLAGKQKWGEEILTASAVEAGADGLVLSVRFTSRLDAEALFARVNTFATGQRQPLVKSWQLLHDCSHDGEVVPCVGAERRDW